LLFVKESIENPQSLNYYCSPDTSTPCCACIRRDQLKSRQTLRSEKTGGKYFEISDKILKISKAGDARNPILI
jgi:hypothetical protein